MTFDLVGPIGEGVNFLKTNFHIWNFSSPQQFVTQNKSAGSISSVLAIQQYSIAFRGAELQVIPRIQGPPANAA